MLETVKQTFNEVNNDNTSFLSAFNQYVMSIQDNSIELELKHLFLHNDLSIKSVSQLLADVFERMIADDFS